jgi:ribosome recycling factor
MQYNFSSFKDEIKKTEDWLRQEFSSLRTARASSAVLDSVRVEAYGSMMPINQVASISSDDPKSLRVSPWDMTLAKAIEKAIQVSNLGLSVTLDDKGLRVIFPELTSERRDSIVKLAKQKLEDGRIAIRTEREKVLKDLEKKEKDGEIGEDEKFRFKNELQKMVDEAGKALEDLFSKKEKEIKE